MASDKSTTVISLPQMVDLALNSPEVGIVNFTVLHSLLHVIVNQLDLGDCNVEFRGSDSERLQNYIASAKPGPIITLTEYTVGPDGKGRKKRAKKGRKASTASDEKGKKDEKQKEKEIAILKKENEEVGESSLQDQDVASTGSQTIVVVSKEKISDSPKFTIALTKENMTKIQKDIKDLQKKVSELTELPGNIGLIDALRSSKDSSNSPILDMFQILTLVKRLDATEVAMNKMASMMEDLAKGQSSLTEAGTRQERISFKEPSRELVRKSQDLRKSLDDTIGGSNQIQDLIGQLREMEVRLENMEASVSQIDPSSRSKSKSKKSHMAQSTASDDAANKHDEDKDADESASAKGEMNEPVDYDTPDITLMPTNEAIAAIQQELKEIKENMNDDAAIQALKEIELLKSTLVSDDKSKNLPPDVKFGQLELKITGVKEQVSTLDTVYNQQFETIRDKIEQSEQEVSAIWERINLNLPPGGDSSTGGVGGQNNQELYNKLLQLQDDMTNLSDTANKLLSEREGRQDSLDIMIEQIELLKTVKADREDLEDALADKADACQINRKVSHEQFDAAYDEFTKQLEETLERLKSQEELWIQSLNDLQKEIGNKLDKMELAPLKDFINSKLKGIQDKVKKISALKQEHEAAGTKSKLLRNVNCISCDADVVMRKQTDITLFPKPYAMPANKSPAPYLAYELDLLRKQQKMPNNKSPNIFESALLAGRSKISDKDHLCNRYCGGSHTVTTPQQRVMRVGHFMEQWGPEIAPVNEVLIKGTDGHLYKGRDDAALRAAANERGPNLKVEAPAALTINPINEYNTKANVKEVKVEIKHENISTNGSANKLDQKVSHSVSHESVGKRPQTSVELGKHVEVKRTSASSTDGKPN